jgi:putative transposase
VRIQILCALISYLLLALYKKAHAFTGSLWMLLATARASLFQRPSLEVARDRRRREQRLALGHDGGQHRIATWRVLRPVRQFGHPQFHGRCLSGGKRCAR